MTDRKELLRAYKEQTVTGGVCAIRFTANGKVWLQSGIDTRRMKNRFDFACATGSCLAPCLETDFRTYGAASFTFEVLEELEMGVNQTRQDFLQDIDTLTQLWRQRFAPDLLY